ncbi:hypothetical protein IMCC3088_1122 [Aequoribacter fuscus]|uniref:Uncharacterized protein n=1 Tax=Aequoribacter fuscus TaxID=2518989 RepID=F3L130_9GAMM|nr:hypothetical protein IMCC3088_1122 [Aequoribacter fuscus]
MLIWHIGVIPIVFVASVDRETRCIPASPVCSVKVAGLHRILAYRPAGLLLSLMAIDCF